jgi:hypothetical protein
MRNRAPIYPDFFRPPHRFDKAAAGAGLPASGLEAPADAFFSGANAFPNPLRFWISSDASQGFPPLLNQTSKTRSIAVIALAESR